MRMVRAVGWAKLTAAGALLAVYALGGELTAAVALILIATCAVEAIRGTRVAAA